MATQAVVRYLRGVSLVLGPGVSSNLLRLLVRLLLLLICRLLLLVSRPLWLLWLLEGLLLEGGLLVGRLDRLPRSWLVVSLLSARLLLLVDRRRPLLLNLQDVADNTSLDYADDHADATAAAVPPAGSSGSDSAEEQLLPAVPWASASSQ